MSSSSPHDTPDLPGQIIALREQITHVLAAASEAPSIPGVAEILQGLDLLVGESATIQGQEELSKLEALLQGVGAMVSLFVAKEEQEEEQGSLPPSTPSGLGQFIEAFRAELKKRLSGLSIALMSAFNPTTDTTKALENSASHLHAIRGSAAMLSLDPVAKISGLMEQIVLAIRRMPKPEHAYVGTQPLMVGFRALEVASNSSDARICPEVQSHAVEVLEACFEQVLSRTTLARLSEASLVDEDVQQKEEALWGGAVEQEAPVASEPSGPVEQRLLIVDDVEMIAASIGFVLSDLELPMDIASDGAEALQMLRNRPYSLVISDIAMPRIDGIALTRMIRLDDALKSIPVVLLTALDHPTERDTGIDAGANDYIIKGSIGGGELLQRVRELLKIAPFVPANRVKESKPKQRVLVAEDAETVAASIAFILSEGDFEIVLASNGHEALTRLERESFDLLMTDWQMPVMNGIELTQATRLSSMVDEGLPIIFLTSLDDEVLHNQALEAGASKYLIKGQIAGGGLLDVVESLLGHDQAKRQG